MPSGLRTTRHVLSERRPDVWIRGTEQSNRRCSDRSGEVCHSGIVSDENRASVQRLAQVRETCIQEGSETPELATRTKFANHFVVRLAADQKKIAQRTIESLNEFDPMIDRPILLGRTAAHVKTERRGLGRFRSDCQPRNWIMESSIQAVRAPRPAGRPRELQVAFELRQAIPVSPRRRSDSVQ